MSAPERAAGTEDRIAAEQWFLRHGLPSVLTPRARWRRLWWRSAPALAALAALFVAAQLIVTASGGDDVDIDENPTPAEVLIIVVVLLCVPVALLAAWCAARVTSVGGRRTIAVASVAVCAVSDLWVGQLLDFVTELAGTALAVGLVLGFNGSGVGSVLGWSIRLTLNHLRSLGALFARALPVLLLTVLVFFNGPVWSMATTIGRGRMWLLIAFMVAVASTFLMTGVLDRAKPVLSTTAVRDADAELLAGTPFATMEDPKPGAVQPLSMGERINVIFVVGVSQFVQIAVVAAMTSAIFLVMGLLALTPALLKRLTVDGEWQGTWLGMTLPIPQALIHVAMFLGALTFMYVSARSVGDGEYRKQFLDPLIEELRAVLVARNRYRAIVRPARSAR